jgi:hypothetical protein
MTTIKEILTANRESVISSIKFVFKIWKAEDVKVKMIELLDYANANYSSEQSIERLIASTKVKTELKYMVQKLSISQKNIEPKKSVAELRGNWMDANNLEFNLRTKKYYSI